MIDFGLLALTVVLLSGAGLSWTAYLSMKREGDSLKELKPLIAAAQKAADEAKALVAQVETDHYKSLLKRVDHLAEENDALKRSQNRMEERVTTLSRQYGGLKRQQQAHDQVNPPETAGVTEELPMFAPLPEPPPSRINGTFGKKAR